VNEHLPAVGLLNEVVEHALGDLEVGNDAVLHRADGDDVARSAAEHLLGFLADGFHLSVVLVDGDDGGFIDDDAFAAGEDEGVRRAEVNGKVRGKEAKQLFGRTGARQQRIEKDETDSPIRTDSVHRHRLGSPELRNKANLVRERGQQIPARRLRRYVQNRRLRVGRHSQ
jgi:hypothetical protein